jgi:hypothetical protein
MIVLDADGLRRWRAEIDLGVEFRDEEFGTYCQQSPRQPARTTLAGRNLDYYEQGARTDDTADPLNLVFPIAKIIVPTLFYQHPRATALPEDRIDGAEEDAFYASELINRDLRDPDFRFKETGQSAVFDSFLLGFGVVKIGYATEFGPDVLPTKSETRQKFRERVREMAKQVLGAITGQPPETPGPLASEPKAVQADLTIRSEHTYLQWISPFDFVVDPRARDLTDARWVAQRIRRTIGEIKRDRRYGKAKFEIEPDAIDDERIPESYIEDFQTADVWEVHYKNPDSPTGITGLTFAAYQEQTKQLLHDHLDYDLGGWQFEWLTPNKHGHRLYPISTISVIRPLLDRASATFDNLLEQIDKFVAKIATNDRVTEDGKKALDSGIIGARVEIEGKEDVRSAIATIALDQVKGELLQFTENIIDLILVIVGVTRAQFTGITAAQTATEAQIGQGGQNIRRTDESNTVAGWTNRVVTKIWRVKAQYQDLAGTTLPQDIAQLNAQTGISQTQWYPPIDFARAQRLKSTRFRFNLEVSSIQKPSLEVIRAQFADFVRNIMEPIVTNGLALEGKRLSASEVIRQYSKFFVEYGLQDMSKMIVPVSDQNQLQALLNYGQKPQGNAQNNGQARGNPPTPSDLISRSAGEKGQGMAPVA